MKKSTRSILEELSQIGISRDTNLVIESRGSNIIQSAINILELIRENYDEETAADLEKRFINSIKSGDNSKFKRGIKKLNNKWVFSSFKINNITDPRSGGKIKA